MCVCLIMVAFGAGGLISVYVMRHDARWHADSITGIQTGTVTTASGTQLLSSETMRGSILTTGTVCPDVPRKFYLQKNKTWVELNPTSEISGYKEIILRLPIMGFVGTPDQILFESESEVTPKEMKRIAWKLLQESTK